MGKVKQKRLRISRYSPTHFQSKSKSLRNGLKKDLDAGCDNVLEQCNEENNGFSSNNEYSLIGRGGLKMAKEKITSSSTDEKVTGLNMLAAFALESKAAESIIESRLATSIAQLLKDESCQVRLAAIGTLRNMCSWGSDDFIEMIVQQDVMEPLTELLKTYENNTMTATEQSLTYSKGVANSMEESDPHNLIFTHATNVLWSLCECNEEAVNLFNRENLVTILLKHINPFVWSYRVSLAAADCLLCVSENNSKVLSSILPLAPTLVSLMIKALSTEYDSLGLHFAVVIAGILLNVGYWVPDGDSNFHQISEILSKVLQVNAASILEANQNNKHTVQENFEHLISAQLIAFEIFSNMCCSEDEDDYEELSEEIEMMGFDECEPMDLEKENSSKAEYDTVPVQVLESVKYHQLIAKTQAKLTEPISNVFWKSEEDTKCVVDRLKQVKIRALQCFQNLVACLPLDDLGGADSIYSTWVQLGQLCFTDSQVDDNLLEALSGAMRAVIEKLGEMEHQKISDITDNDLQPILSFITSCENSSVKANLCRMIGALGCSAVRQSKEAVLCSSCCPSLILSIADTLSKVGQNDSSLYVQAEAIDVLIDLFSDDKTDKIAAQIHLVDTFKGIHPQFKAKYNQQKKKLGEHRPLLLTVKDNLAAFIKYKASRTSKYLKMIS